MVFTERIVNIIVVCWCCWNSCAANERDDKLRQLFPDHAVETSKRLHSILDTSGTLSKGASIQEIESATFVENGTENSKPHQYLLSVWRELMTKDMVHSYVEPSVVAILPETVSGTDPWGEDNLTLVFNLSGSGSLSIESITGAEVVVYLHPNQTDQLCSDSNLTIRAALCNDGICNFDLESGLITEQLQVFNLTEPLKDWNASSLTLELTVLDASDSETTLAADCWIITENPEQGPLLILYQNMEPVTPHPAKDLAAFHDGQDTVTITPSMETRAAARRLRRETSDNSVSAEQHAGFCRLHSWVINFHRDLKWTWIKYPPSFQENYCSGICPTPLKGKELNSTNNAFIRDQFQVQTQWQHTEIPPSCCVPNKLAPLDVYYVQNKDHIIKRLPDMMVVSCACL